MPKRKDSETPAAEIATAAPTAAPDMVAAKDAAPSVDIPTIGPVLPAEAIASGTDAEPPAAPRRQWPAYTRLAAGIAIAVAIGAVAGAASTASLLRERSAAADPAAANATRALRDSVAQLGNELATLKTGLVTAQRGANTQLGKLAERLDRAEKAQAEPTAKLAKIQESIDRLDRRQQQAALTPAAASDITGSVTPKTDIRPPVVEGWRLRDFYAGRAVVESRNGRLFEIGPGSNLPGLGRVETIKREGGKVVVTTPNGIIAASLEPRRPASGYLPYRY
jgi:hypothetical protein